MANHQTMVGLLCINNYVDQSRSQEDYNHHMLQQVSKGIMKMSEYMSTMKKHFSNLELEQTLLRDVRNLHILCHSLD